MDKFNIGQYVERRRAFIEEEVKHFAELSQDVNPVHLSEDFAANTIFKKPIVHGFLYGSMLSALIANELPGPGSVYMYQELKFKAPVYYDEVLIARVEITEINHEKKIITLNTSVKKEQKDVIVISGIAKIKFFG